MPEEQGKKYDDGKRQWSLLPWEEVGQIVDVLMVGMKKYSADNWKRVPDAKRRYFDAAMRHLTAWKNGERCDNEDGLSHLSHLGCCVLFLAWFDNQELVSSKLDEEMNQALSATRKS